MAPHTHRTAPVPHEHQRPPWWLPWLAGGSMTLLAARCTVPYHVGTPDTWIQLLSGHSFWHHGLPTTDPFNYSATDAPWVDHEWLACLLVYGVWTAAGAPRTTAAAVFLRGQEHREYSRETAICCGMGYSGEPTVQLSPLS